jgi:hypothetical protein
MLEGAKQAVVANMAQYESALASAQGQAAVAKINEELAKTFVDIYRHADQNAIALRNQALDQWKTKIHASLEQTSLGLRRQELAMKQKELDKQDKTLLDPIYDPETGKAKWVFLPGIKDSEKEKTREKLEGVEDVNQALTELRELTRTNKTVFDPFKGTRFADTGQQKFDSLAKRIAHGMAKANGERATDDDVKQFSTGFRQATWLNMANAEQVIANTQKQVLRSALSKLKTVARDLPEDMQDQFGLSARGEPFTGAATDARNTSSPPPLSEEEKARIEAGTLLRPADKDEKLRGSDVPTSVRLAKEDFFSKNPDLKSTTPTLTGEMAGGFKQFGAEIPEELAVTRGDMGLTRLRDAVMAGIHEHSTEDDIAHARTAYKQLRDRALPSLSGKGPVQNKDFFGEDTESAFAAYLLNELPTGIAVSLGVDSEE